MLSWLFGALGGQTFISMGFLILFLLIFKPTRWFVIGALILSLFI